MAPKPQATSLVLHVLAIVLLILWSLPSPRMPPPGTTQIHLIAPRLERAPSSGGSAIGPKATPKGILPQPQRIFVPPTARVDYIPKLMVAASIDAPQLAPNSGAIGLPDGVGNLPGGSGGLVGLGGNGTAGSYGYGDGNHGAGVFSGKGVVPPVPIRKPEPEYSDSARRARINGSVLVYAVIGADGVPRQLRVVRAIGFGLDEKALEAVSRWFFKPGTKDGRAVPVAATIEVNFRLL
jgi:periplasmic protein TonB